MKLKQWFRNQAIKFGIKRVKRKSSIIKELLDNPENVKLEAYIEGEEIIVKIKKRSL